MSPDNKRVVERMKGEVLTTEQVAEILQLSRATVVRRFSDGTIQATLIGNKWRCPKSSIDKLFQTA